MSNAFKRLGAYFLDMIIIYFIAAFISSIVLVISGNDNQFLTKFDQYNTFEIETNEFKNLLNDSYSDNKITEDEYNKLVKEYTDLTSDYKVSDIGLEEYYKDFKITKKEFNQISANVENNYNDISPKLFYAISKMNVFNTICSIVLSLLYFVVFAYLMKGQTIGKKIFKFRVVSNDDSRASINQLLLRTLVITDVIWGLLRIYCLMTMNEYGYQNVVFFLNSMIYYILFISLLFMLYRKDRRALQDLFANTKVIEEKK